MKYKFRFLENRWAVFALLIVLALFVSGPLFIDGWFWTHEEFSPTDRVIALVEEMYNGDLYPRWLSQTYRGKGSPFFNFYSPAFHFVAAWLHLAGFSLLASIKIPLGLLFFVGAWGVYLWIRRHYGATGAAVAAILYLFAPYHLVDIYVRGAFAEFSALAVLPYLFYGIDLLLNDIHDRRKGFLITVASTAAIFLSHQLSAMMITPFALIYSMYSLAIIGFSLRKLALLATAPVVAAGLSAFYWLPVLAEKQYLQDFSKTVLRSSAGGYYYADHFVYPSQLVSTFWGFGNSINGSGDTMSFQIGLTLIIASVVALATLIISAHMKRAFSAQLLLLGVLAIFMTSEYSVYLYRLADPLVFVQFPWRFLGPATLFLSAFGGSITMGQIAGRFQIAVLATVIAASIYFSNDQRRVYLPNVPISPAYETTRLKMRKMMGLNASDEYLPKWADRLGIADTPEVKPLAISETLSLSGSITEVVAGNKQMRFTYTGEQSYSVVGIPWYYFPGWQGKIDGLPARISPTSDGYLAVNVPVGRHQVEIFFGTTWPRATGWSVAGITLLFIVLWMSGNRFSDRKRDQ